MMTEQTNKNLNSGLKFIQENKIYNEIQNNKKIIIFDLRTKEEFEASHLELSINIPYDEHDEQFYETFCSKKVNLLLESYSKDNCVKERLKNYKRYFVGLIMSQDKIKRVNFENSDSFELDESRRDRIKKTLLFYKSLVNSGVRELGIFNRGLNKFEENYSFLVSKNGEKPLMGDVCSFPTDVLNHRLYVGNQREATCEEVIKCLKITHIVNVTQHVFNKFEDRGVKYLNIGIDDTDKYKISPHFKTAFNFIEEALTSTKDTSTDHSDSECSFNTIEDLESWREIFEKAKDLNIKNKIIQNVFENCAHLKNNSRVLIHCSMGVSRSPTVAVMYLMRKFRIGFDEAYSLMLHHREKSAPIESFLDELRNFENEKCEFCENVEEVEVVDS